MSQAVTQANQAKQLKQKEYALLSFVQASQSTAEPAGGGTTVTPLLSLRQVKYTLADGRVLLDGINLNLQVERAGLVGRNGAGKSMLAKIIVGNILPDQGQVIRYVPLAYNITKLKYLCDNNRGRYVEYGHSCTGI